jgi:hypothetical protein
LAPRQNENSAPKRDAANPARSQHISAHAASFEVEAGGGGCVSLPHHRGMRVERSCFPMLVNSGYVQGVMSWGWIYGKTWSSARNSGLIKNGSFRPAMTWLMQQLGRPTN